MIFLLYFCTCAEAHSWELKYMTKFEQFHPIALFSYYVVVLIIGMFTLHPVLIGITALAGFLFFAGMRSIKEIIGSLIFYVFLFLLITITNPMFSHNGKTILFFMNGKPMTLEALLYGAAIAVMLIGILFWCKCYNLVMTTDKFIYLFGKIIPKMSLILSMAFRFIPVFKAQAKKIRMVQRSMGLYATDSLLDRFLGSVRVFSSLLTWALENAIETADSMKARGYGLKGRTNYSIFTFQIWDGMLIGISLSAIILFLTGYYLGYLEFYYYPAISDITITGKTVWQYAIILLFMLIPCLTEVKGKIQWKLLKSRI